MQKHIQAYIEVKYINQ